MLNKRFFKKSVIPGMGILACLAWTFHGRGMDIL